MRPFVQFFFVICFILFSGLFLSSVLGVDPLCSSGKEGASSDLEECKTLALSDYVSVPVSSFNELKLMAEEGNTENDLQLNRADYFLSLSDEQPSLFCRMHIYSPDNRLRTVRPFFSPSPLFAEVSVIPAGATVVTKRYGPEISLLSPVQAEATVRWRPLLEKGRIRFSSRHFSITNLIVPSAKILPVAGMTLKWDDGNEACYEINPPIGDKQYTSVELLVKKDDDSALLPELTGATTLFEADELGIVVRASINGAGRGIKGGVSQILLPALWQNVTIKGHGTIAKVLPFDDKFQSYTIAIDETAPVFWELTFKAIIPLDKKMALRLSPGIPFGLVNGEKKAVSSFVGLMKDGPRRFRFAPQSTLENLGLWRVNDSRIIRIITQWTGLKEECRELYETLNPKISPELFVDPLDSIGLGSNLLVVDSLSAESNVIGQMGRSKGLSVYTRAKYEIGNGGSGSILFSLPLSAQLRSISVDGEIVVAGSSSIALADDGSIVFTSKGKQNSLVSIDYSEVASEPGLFSHMALALPKVSEPVFSSRWNVNLPKSYNIISVESEMSSSFSNEVFLFRRLGNSVVDYSLEFVSVLRNEGIPGLLPDRLTSIFRKVWEGDKASLTRTFEDTISGGSLAVTSPLSDSSILNKNSSALDGQLGLNKDKGGALASLDSTQTGENNNVLAEQTKVEKVSLSSNKLCLEGGYSSQCCGNSVVLRAVSSNYISLCWSLATLAGLISLTYLWSLLNDCAPVSKEIGIPLLIGILLVLDIWFPFALPGYSWAFFVVIAFLSVYVFGILIDLSLAVYRAKKEAIKEAGTIGDLEGEEIFYASRRKHNIIPLANLFAFTRVYVPPVVEKPDDDGIEFIVINDSTDTSTSTDEPDSSSKDKEKDKEKGNVDKCSGSEASDSKGSEPDEKSSGKKGGDDK